MTIITMELVDKSGETKSKRIGDKMTYLDLSSSFNPGDRVRVIIDKAGCYLIVQVDEALNPSLVYLTGTVWEYVLPLDEKLREAYPGHAFLGEHKYLFARVASEREVGAYQNLALNPHDQKHDSGAYPHAFANVETRNDATFFARNAIDGVIANESHGPYPYQSWGINRQRDAWLVVDFGRKVEVNRVDVVLRADFPHDSYWTQATLEFSDGSEEVLGFSKVYQVQSFSFTSRTTQWLKLKELIKAEDDSPFPALTQIEVYGNNVN